MNGNLTVVRLCITVLHMVVGCMFIIRKPLISNPSFVEVAATIPSLVISGVVFKLAGSTQDWNTFSNSIFIGGAVISVVSVLYLGASFSVLPASRNLVSKGPYKFIRHPIYLGEMLMVFACFTANPKSVFLPGLLACLGLIIRIGVEESFLTKNNSYEKYLFEVKWKMIPYIW